MRDAERYTALAQQSQPDDRTREELEEVEKALDLLDRALVVQHQDLERDDLADLSVDRRVFEELLTLDERMAREATVAELERTRE